MKSTVKRLYLKQKKVISKMQSNEISMSIRGEDFNFKTGV